MTPQLDALVSRLADVRGVVAVVLGGSRAKGTAHAASDYDIGLYFRAEAPLHVAALRALAEDGARPGATVTEIGEWGARIVGGAWLNIDGVKVDWLYRELGAVRAAIDEARLGRFRMDYQPGHPHGFASTIWAGEVALCRPLADPEGAIARLKALTEPYPEALSAALRRTFLWEIGFSLDNAALALPRGDATHVAGCLYRALGCLGQVLFATERRWLINEKGALAEAHGFACAPPDLSARVAAVWAAFAERGLARAVELARGLQADAETLRV